MLSEFNPTNIQPKGLQVRIAKVPSPKYCILKGFWTFIKPSNILANGAEVGYTKKYEEKC